MPALERTGTASELTSLSGVCSDKEHYHYSLLGHNQKVIMTEEGKRNVNDDLILCMDRPQSVGEHLDALSLDWRAHPRSGRTS
jgi:hypothetical protein